jgi:hypothetical protein
MGADFTLPGNPSAGEQRSASSTSLKWGSNGELSPVDLQRVLERLTDPSLVQCQLDRNDSGG